MIFVRGLRVFLLDDISIFPSLGGAYSSPASGLSRDIAVSAVTIPAKTPQSILSMIFSTRVIRMRTRLYGETLCVVWSISRK